MADGGLDGGRVFQAGRERSAPAVSEGGGFQGESGWLEWQNLHRDRGSPSARRLGLSRRRKNPGAIRGCGTAGPEGRAPDEACSRGSQALSRRATSKRRGGSGQIHTSQGR